MASRLRPLQWITAVMDSDAPPAVRHAAHIVEFVAFRHTDQSGRFSLPHDEVADRMGASRATARRCIAELVAAGFLHRHGDGRGGRQKANRYTICLPERCSHRTGKVLMGEHLYEHPTSVPNEHPYYVVSTEGASDTAPRSAGAGSDEKGTPEPATVAEPVPALGGAEPEPASETEALDAAAAEHRDAASGVVEWDPLIAELGLPTDRDWTGPEVTAYMNAKRAERIGA